MSQKPLSLETYCTDLPLGALPPGFRSETLSTRPRRLTNGDTLKGWIDYRNWHVNPTSIRYKQDSIADDSRLFTIADISFFEVAGDKYLKAFVKKDMLPVDINHMVSDFTVMQQTDTAFLRVLTEGPVLNLYELYDFKPHYYIQDSTKIITS